jgi:hypothetical protein
MKEYTEPEIKAKVEIALGMLLKNDAFLLEHDVNERSISHKLAEYLQQLFPDYHVDCEYNRHGIGIKRLPRICQNEAHERVHPDIVVHLRGIDDFNMLVIEIKPTITLDVCDKTKLGLFTNKTGLYGYRYGLFIGFNGFHEPKLIWFSNGKQKR